MPDRDLPPCGSLTCIPSSRRQRHWRVGMTRVTFTCGPADSGKSTIARAMESEGCVHLSFDQEAWELGIRQMPLTPDAHHSIETRLRDQLLDPIGTGCAIVLDFSFWSRAMREQWRWVLEPCGVIPETIYLATGPPAWSVGRRGTGRWR